jgi:serine/threonine protein kinase/tetratricopeptide (TPR) repeat protein
MQATGEIPTRIDWPRLQELFARALTCAPDKRIEFVTQETTGEPELRAELLALLESVGDTNTGPLSRAVGMAYADVLEEQDRGAVGQVVGNYRLVSILGRGGAGTVYLGERADHQYSAKVAVKIVDPATLNGSLGARFRAERQILASLNHPNIARLLDAGETESGAPYLIMEYVGGEPLDKYCDNKQLSVEARLRLFEQICAAVQYAHQNLIVHRDLKPANIMVTPDGTPKLLDFGIAKLLDLGEGAQVMDMTRLNDRLLTPEYASPEQILGGNITTSSDVYSLGVILYQLLCGLRPYKVPQSGSQLELERSICVSDPERPSVAIKNTQRSSAPLANLIAQGRSTTPEKLTRALQGDIDSIVLRALRKEPDHRYSSVEQFAADVHRYLTSEPVQARQGNWLYYGQRFARRHTLGVAAGAGFLVFVIGVAIVMSVQREQIAVALERARDDAQRAETVSEFMLDVFGAADPFVHFGKEPSARTLLEQAARRIQTDLDQQPAVRARLLETIGRSYRRMGQPDRAVPYLSDALRLQETLNADANRIGSVLMELATAQREAALYDESDHTFARAMRVVEAVQDTQTEAYAQLLSDLGRLEMIRNNIEQAQAHFLKALDLMRQVRGADDHEVGSILTELSSVYIWKDDLETAERTARAAVQTFARAPETHPDRVIAERELAEILLYRNRLDLAAPLFERSIAALRLIYGEDNAIVAETLGSLAQLRSAQGRYSEAESLLRRALTIHREAGSTITHEIGYLQTLLAAVLLNQQRYADSEPLLRETLDLFARSLPSDHQYVASAEHYLGEALLGQRKYTDAATVLTASMNRWARTGAPAWRVARTKNTLGEVFYRQGRMAEAEEALVTTFRELAGDAGADMDSKRRARERVARFYAERGQPEKFVRLERSVGSPVALGR